MRIIAGEYRSRRLKTPAGRATRPTSDRLRETLFNVAGPAVPGSTWYDCFAGSGAVGLEALSRGAAFAVFFETGRDALRALRANIAALDAGARCRVVEQPVAQALARAERPADFLFLDPPYAAEREYARLLAWLGEAPPLLAPAATVIVEHARRSTLAPAYGRLSRVRLLEQGSSAFSFYRLT